MKRQRLVDTTGARARRRYSRWEQVGPLALLPIRMLTITALRSTPMWNTTVTGSSICPTVTRPRVARSGNRNARHRCGSKHIARTLSLTGSARRFTRNLDILSCPGKEAHLRAMAPPRRSMSPCRMVIARWLGLVTATVVLRTRSSTPVTWCLSGRTTSWRLSSCGSALAWRRGAMATQMLYSTLCARRLRCRVCRLCRRTLAVPGRWDPAHLNTPGGAFARRKHFKSEVISPGPRPK